MLLLLKILLLSIMGLQAGLALSASVIVQPALLKIPVRSAVEMFTPFFHITHRLMIAASVVVSVLAIILSILTKSWWWVAIATVMHFNGPYTLKLMMPTNHRLLAKQGDDEEIRCDIEQWGKLHVPRTLLNITIFIAFLLLALS